LTQFAAIIIPVPTGTLDSALSNGHFYKQANGFGGAGDLGYPVVDDSQANFWSEFQRLGGLNAVGYPVSYRFMYHGFLTQAFQRLALQWRPELGQTVPVNVLEELSARGSDSWLDKVHQVPLPNDTSADIGQDFEAVVARHVMLLDAFPAIQEAYLADEDSLTRLGLPLAAKNYGPFSAVRFQRGVLQLWQTSTSFAAAGSILSANSGDLAKDAGLWPAEATVPGGPTPPASTGPATYP
jgi:hypothetical protein